MALDWSKEISFSGLRKRKPNAKKSEYPSKTYINLVVQNKREFDVRRSVPLIVLTVLVVAAVCKFGIFDFYARLAEKQVELTKQEQVLAGIQAQLGEYDAVKAEYDLYEASKLAADDMTVSALDAMSLVDKYVARRANVDSIELEGNTVSLNLSNITLNGVGTLVSTLYQQPMVANVSVSTAGTEQTKAADNTAAMVITLRKVAGDDAQAGDDAASSGAAAGSAASASAASAG